MTHVYWNIRKSIAVLTVLKHYKYKPHLKLEDKAIGVRSPAEAKDFSSSLCVQTISEAHPASYPVGAGGPFPGVKHSRSVTLTIHPHLMQRLL
jgi:hypothetical protein